MTVQNLAEYRIKAHLREHFETRRLSPARAPVVPLQTPAHGLAPDDDAHLQEGAARFRTQQADYERHTSSAQEPRRRRTDTDTGSSWRRFWHVASSMLGGILFAAAVLLYVAWTSKAMGQTPPTILVRACPATPAATGFSACTNSTWSTPASGIVVDAQRAGIDTWLTPDRLQAGDTVFACEDPTVAPGPFKTCPSLLPGQTNNYLAGSAISFGTPPSPATPPSQPPPLGNGTWKLSWEAVTLDNQTLPAPLTKPVSYQVFVRLQSTIDFFGPPASADVSATSVTLTLAPGDYCAVVAAYFTGETTIASEGQQSNEVCKTIMAPAIKPGKVAGLTTVEQ